MNKRLLLPLIFMLLIAAGWLWWRTGPASHPIRNQEVKTAVTAEHLNQPKERRPPSQALPGLDSQPSAPHVTELPAASVQEQAARKKASALYRSCIAYAMNNGGSYPADLSGLVAEGYIKTEEAGDFMKDVIDYRGAGMTNSDKANLVIMRYRIGDRTDKEVRVFISGSVAACAPTDPLPPGTPLLPHEDDATRVPAAPKERPPTK
jgi:hypothetical protein